MRSDHFNKIVTDQLAICTDVLVKKAEEYATDADRLHNFQVAAALQGTTMRQACAGFMAKHTVSVYDMCKSPETYSIEMWDEKITDHMNYLLLLRAILREEAMEAVQQDQFHFPHESPPARKAS